MSMKVLVVDDSAFMRKVISDCLNQIEGVEVGGIARSGEDALRLIPKVKPDVVTLDIEMPGLNGLETLRQIKEAYDIPVIMLSSHSGEDITIEALELGAGDFIEKPQNIREVGAEFITELKEKISSLGKSGTQLSLAEAGEFTAKSKSTDFPPKINCLVIGASTGGPRALMSLIKKIPATLRIPILIVQHMPAGFTRSFAKRLNQEAKVKVVEAADGMLIEKGTIYLAPGNFHMTIEHGYIVLDDESPKVHGVRPAVDYLFESAATVYGKFLVGIILTGMGNDGTLGLTAIKQKGGYTLAQDQASSVVFGMPRSGIEAGVVDEIASLDEIGEKISWMIRVKQWS